MTAARSVGVLLMAYQNLEMKCQATYNRTAVPAKPATAARTQTTKKALMPLVIKE